MVVLMSIKWLDKIERPLVWSFGCQSPVPLLADPGTTASTGITL